MRTEMAPGNKSGVLVSLVQDKTGRDIFSCFALPIFKECPEEWAEMFPPLRRLLPGSCLDTPSQPRIPIAPCSRLNHNSTGCRKTVLMSVSQPQ